jgi:hypothetical protein
LPKARPPAIIDKIFRLTKHANRLKVRLVGNGLTPVMQFIGPFGLFLVTPQQGLVVLVSSSLRHCSSALGSDLYLRCLGARSRRLLARYHPISCGVRRMARARFASMMVTGFSCRI